MKTDSYIHNMVYGRLKALDKKLSQEQFCRDYLDRSYHYTSMCRSRGIDISESAKLALYRSLKGLAEAWLEISEIDDGSLGQSATNCVKLFEELAEAVDQELKSELV